MERGAPFPNVAPSGAGSYKALPRPMRQLVESPFGDPQFNLKPFTQWEITLNSDCLVDADFSELQGHYLDNVGKFFAFYDWLGWTQTTSRATDMISIGLWVPGQVNYSLPIRGTGYPDSLVRIGYRDAEGVIQFVPVGDTEDESAVIAISAAVGVDGTDMVTFTPEYSLPAGTPLYLMASAKGQRRFYVYYLNDTCPVRFDSGEVWTMDEPIRLKSLLSYTIPAPEGEEP